MAIQALLNQHSSSPASLPATPTCCGGCCCCCCVGSLAGTLGGLVAMIAARPVVSPVPGLETPPRESGQEPGGQSHSVGSEDSVGASPAPAGPGSSVGPAATRPASGWSLRRHLVAAGIGALLGALMEVFLVGGPASLRYNPTLGGCIVLGALVGLAYARMAASGRPAWYALVFLVLGLVSAFLELLVWTLAIGSPGDDPSKGLGLLVAGVLFFVILLVAGIGFSRAARVKKS